MASTRASLLRICDQLSQQGSAISHENSHPFGPGGQVEEFQLANGLVILALRDKSAPVVSYHTWFDVGSRHEQPGKTGIAHLLEHLMFNETESLPATEFDRQMEEAGAESNAATWCDWTNYYEDLPKAALPLVIRLEAERMHKLVLRAPQVATEKEVVCNERRQTVDNDIDGKLSEVLYATALPVHGYGHTTIGSMADIKGLTPEDCQEFYRTYYAPNNAAVVVVGDFEYKSLLKRLVEAYGKHDSAEIPVEDVQPEPIQSGERRKSIELPMDGLRIAIGYRSPAICDADYLPLAVVCEALFGGRSSRLHRKLVHETELCIHAGGWLTTFRDPGLFDINLAGRPGASADTILQAFEEEVTRLKESGLAERELLRVKSRFELGALRNLTTASGKAEQIGFWHMIARNPAMPFLRLQTLRHIGRGDILRVVRRYLVPSQRTIVVATPKDAASASGLS